MIYIIFVLIFKPFLYLLSPFRDKKSGSLLIQTAKIGDYVNTSVMIETLGRCDVLIEGVNADLAENDARVERVWLVDGYKRSMAGRLALAVDIFWRNYETIYVAMPNNLNLFLAIMGHTDVSTFRHYKSGATSRSLFYFCDSVVTHTKDTLTIDTYLKLIDDELTRADVRKRAIKYRSYPPLPKSLLSKKQKVGIALSAGNKIKELSVSEWVKIFRILDDYDVEIHLFGLITDNRLLEKIAEEAKLQKASLVSHLGELRLYELPFAISQLSLFIASDTAGVYIADSYDIPVVVYAGPCHMDEQRPIGEKVLIVASNAPCAPFSFIFNAPYRKKCDGLYDTTETQQEEIRGFIGEVLSVDGEAGEEQKS